MFGCALTWSTLRHLWNTSSIYFCVYVCVCGGGSMTQSNFYYSEYGMLFEMGRACTMQHAPSKIAPVNLINSSYPHSGTRSKKHPIRSNVLLVCVFLLGFPPTNERRCATEQKGREKEIKSQRRRHRRMAYVQSGSRNGNVDVDGLYAKLFQHQDDFK